MRRTAREAVLKALYRGEFLPGSMEEALGEEKRRIGDRDWPFASALLTGVRDHRDELDRLIHLRAEGWGIDRLPLVDRNILRMGVYELLHTDTPGEVVINEAVELAKAYGSEHAPAVVNGILDRLWKEKKGGHAA